MQKYFVLFLWGPKRCCCFFLLVPLSATILIGFFCYPCSLLLCWSLIRFNVSQNVYLTFDFEQVALFQTNYFSQTYGFNVLLISIVGWQTYGFNRFNALLISIVGCLVDSVASPNCYNDHIVPSRGPETTVKLN